MLSNKNPVKINKPGFMYLYINTLMKYLIAFSGLIQNVR